MSYSERQLQKFLVDILRDMSSGCSARDDLFPRSAGSLPLFKALHDSSTVVSNHIDPEDSMGACFLCRIEDFVQRTLPVEGSNICVVLPQAANLGRQLETAGEESVEVLVSQRLCASPVNSCWRGEEFHVRF